MIPPASTVLATSSAEHVVDSPIVGVLTDVAVGGTASAAGGGGGSGGGGGGGGGGVPMRYDNFGNLVVPVGGGVFGNVVVPPNIGANSVQEWMTSTPSHANPAAALSTTGE